MVRRSETTPQCGEVEELAVVFQRRILPPGRGAELCLKCQTMPKHRYQNATYTTRLAIIAHNPNKGAPRPVCTPCGYAIPAISAPGRVNASMIRILGSLYGRYVSAIPTTTDVIIPAASEISTKRLGIEFTLAALFYLCRLVAV